MHHTTAVRPEPGPVHKHPLLRFLGRIAVSAAALLPLPTVSFLKQKLQRPAALQHFLQCAETYKYYLAVRRHIKKSGALLYFAEAPELSKLRGLSAEQRAVLDRKMTTSQLLDDAGYLEKAYCGCSRCLAFAKTRFRGTRLYSNGRYTIPADFSGEYYNVANGIRYTPAARTDARRRIYLFGSCIARGYGVSDEYTISNILQEQLNGQAPADTAVINRGTGGATGYPGVVNDLKYMLDTFFAPGDIVVFLSYHTFLEPLIRRRQKQLYLECSPLFSDGAAPGWWFLNSAVHLNQIGNRVIAEELFKKLAPLLTADETPRSQTAGRGSRPHAKLSPELEAELQQYLSWLESAKPAVLPDSAGAIVMNCNPFTLGHKYLIETASREVGLLYVFVVEEDRSFFRYEDRFEMVRRGTAGLRNVIVVPSGKFILSALTFPEYFQKEENPEVRINAAADLEIFGNIIAPVLGITVRFAGSEPFDAVTAQYNRQMAGELAQYGIEFRCIERCRLDGEYISATKVRGLLRAGKFEALQQYVPDSTAEILKKYLPAADAGS